MIRKKKNGTLIRRVDKFNVKSEDFGSKCSSTSTTSKLSFNPIKIIIFILSTDFKNKHRKIDWNS